MARFIKAGETVAARRRVFMQVVGVDGISPALAEAGGQPQATLDGAAWDSALIGTLTAIGNGRYYADLAAAAVATAGKRIETRYKSATTAEIPGDSAEVVSYDPVSAIADILGKTNTLGSGTVTFVSPVSADGEEIYLVSGDDYKAVDGRQLPFTIAAGWPNITGGTCFLNINDGQLVVAGVITSSGIGTQSFYFELTAAQTGGLDQRQYNFDIRCLTAAGNKFTPIYGTAYVNDTEAN